MTAPRIPGRAWTARDDAIVRELVAGARVLSRWEVERAAASLRRSYGSLVMRISLHRAAMGMGKEHANREGSGRTVHERCPAHVLAERDERMEASYRRSQTSEFCGDPAPGYSALDRRRAP